MIALVGKQGRQQALPVRARLVHRRATENPTLNQVRVPEDAQVAADPGLLQAGDQAEITDARLARVSQEGQESDAVGITESVSLAAQALCFLSRQEPLAERVCRPRIGDLQARGLVSHDR